MTDTSPRTSIHVVVRCCPWPHVEGRRAHRCRIAQNEILVWSPLLGRFAPAPQLSQLDQAAIWEAVSRAAERRAHRWADKVLAAGNVGWAILILRAAGGASLSPRTASRVAALQARLAQLGG